MSDHSLDGSSGMGRDFRSSHDGPEMPLDYDAQNWEPTETPDIEEPSEKHLEMHYTPGGALEQEVHTEIDEASRQRIAEAQQREAQRQLEEEKELDFSNDFEQAGGYDNDPFETGRRFERENDHERGDDFGER